MSMVSTSNSRLILAMYEVGMSHGFIKTMLISTLQRLSLRVSYPFNRKVVALNKRLNRMNMMIWWEGDEYFINQTAADKRFGLAS